MAVPVFDPDAPSEEVAAPRFDPTQAFEEVAAPKFDPKAPFEEYDPRVAKMAAATRHTVGVVGRAVAATDFAIRNIPDEQPATVESQTPALTPDQTKDQWGRPLDPRGRNPAEAAPSLFESRTAEPALSILMKPLVTLPRVTGKDVTDALLYLGSLADMPPEYSEAMQQHNATPGNVEKIIAGAQRAAVSVPEAFTSPVGIATLGAGMLPAAAGRLVAGAFTVDMASHIPEQVTQLKDAIASGDSERITEASGNLLATGAMVGAAGKHALTSTHPAARVGAALMESVKKADFVDPKLAALRQVAPLTAEAVVKVNPEPTAELKPGDVLPIEPTPLTTAAVESVKAKEPAPEAPAPAPPEPAQSVTGETVAAKPEGERTLTTEPVAKVQAEVSKVASEEGQHSAKDIKTDLVQSIEAAIEKAPSITDLTPKQREAFDEAKRLADVEPRNVQQLKERNISLEASMEQAGLEKVTIEIPGDGTFTVWNTKETLSDILKRAKRIATKPTPEPTVKTRGISKEDNAEVARLIKAGTGETGLAGEGATTPQRRTPTPPRASEPQGAIATPGPPMSPAATPAPVLPPKSQRHIITDIAQGLKLPIRFGRLRTNRFAGYFLKLQNLIGSKRANDIPIVSHEAGHKLDATFSFSTDPALRAELEFLGDPASVAGSRSSWTKSKSQKYKRGEGVAEFVRYYLTDPPAAAKHAPAMARAFEAALDSNKDFGDTMRQAQSDIQTWRNAEPQARLRSHISVGGNPNKTPYTASQLTRDLVDDLNFMRLAANDAKAAGTDLSPSQNPYTLARNLRGSYGMADSFINNGVADFKTKEVTLGTSLEDALKPVAGRIADFRDWIIAKRAQELHGQGRETGLVDSDVQFTAAKFDKDAAFQDAFAKVKKWQDSLLQYAEDSGFVTSDGAAAMRQMNADYVPLHRVFEVGAGEAPAVEGSGTGRGLNVGKPGSLRRLTGSPRDIVDPLETMVRNAYAIITASEKHAINLAVADMARLPDMGKWVEHIKTPQERVKVGVEKLRKQLEAEGADMTAVPDDVMLQFFQNSRQAPFGENVIKVVRDGKPEFYRLKRELFETFNALDLEDSGTLVRMLSAPSQVLRAGVVLDPSFALANVMRDAFTSAIVSRHGLLPFEATLRGVQAMLKNPKLVAEWEAAGGKNAIEANYFDRQKLQKFLAEKITKDLTPAERALITVKSPLQALRWLTSLGEEATRIGEYQKAFEDLRKGGMSEGDARRQAAFESRDRQDFAKGGAKTKIPRRLAAFWNAGIQGNVRLAQAFRERPMQTTMKGLAFITIPKLIEQSLNWDDEDYWDRPQWERDLFFLIPAGKGEDGHTRFIRIPTPFEAGIIFGTLPGRILQSIREGSGENMKSFTGVALKQTIPNPTPQFALTIFEDFMVGKKGYDVYRGRQIVPESIAQLPADMQWTEQTSLAARKLGAALGFPPVKIDHIINQTTGGLGKQVTHQIVDRAISAATGEERTAKGVVPGGRFVTTPAAVSSQAIDDFYTTLDKVKTAAAGEKKGRDDELARFKPMFTATEAQMSQLRRSMRQTRDEAQKNVIAQDILKLARDTMKNFKEQSQ